MSIAVELLTYDESALLREALHELRFDVWEYFRDGEYPSHQSQKQEVERRVEAFVASWDDRDLAITLRHNERYLREWVPAGLADATTQEELARLAGLAELQWQIENSRSALMLDALNPPRADQPLARTLPEVLEGLSRDGLMRVRAENVTDAGGSLQVFRHGAHALYPIRIYSLFANCFGCSLTSLASPSSQSLSPLTPTGWERSPTFSMRSSPTSGRESS